jgi:hypothetical protein
VLAIDEYRNFPKIPISLSINLKKNNMETQKCSLLKSSMNYGLITGLIVIVYSLILYFTGLHLNQTMGYLTIAIIAVCIYFCSKQYRDTINNGAITFGQAFSLGILIGIFTAILLSFFTFLELTFIDPTIVDKQLEIMQEKLLTKGLSEDQVEQAIIMSKKWMTPGKMFIMSILTFAFYSAIISLVTSALLKKDKNPFDNTTEASKI